MGDMNLLKFYNFNVGIPSSVSRNIMSACLTINLI